MAFFEEVHKIVRKIPAGKVATYGQIAQILGTKDARRVGHALHANRDHKTPCHRVVNKDGKVSASFAFEGAEEQKRRLMVEGVCFRDELHVDLEKHQWQN